MNLQTEPGRIFVNDAQGKLLAEVTFPLTDGVAEITHTYVDSSLRGQGVADRLLAAAIEQICEHQWKVQPTCSYAARWFQEHPEHEGLLLSP